MDIYLTPEQQQYLELLLPKRYCLKTVQGLSKIRERIKKGEIN
jgi:hypothetical protein